MGKKIKFKFICVNRNEFYTHQRKINIGEVYLGHFVKSDSVAIYTDSEEFIGFYDLCNFVKLDEMRNRKINEILG
jgi:hypothetical protein